MSSDEQDTPPKEQLVTGTIRLIIALIVLGAIQVLLSFLPGTGQVVFDPDITVGTILFSVVTLVMFAAVLDYAVTFGDIAAKTMPQFSEMEQIVRLVGALIVVVWAYQTFWWLPYFRTHPSQYKTLFLVAGVGVGGWLGYLLYTNVDDLAEIVSRQIIDGRGEPAGTEEAVAGENEE